jgi:hypothetical protein
MKQRLALKSQFVQLRHKNTIYYYQNNHKLLESLKNHQKVKTIAKNILMIVDLKKIFKEP